jgi:hypothetical protein
MPRKLAVIQPHQTPTPSMANQDIQIIAPMVTKYIIQPETFFFEKPYVYNILMLQKQHIVYQWNPARHIFSE